MTDKPAPAKAGDQKPPEKLQPGSWTEAEVDALVGRRVRFKNSSASGSGEGTVRDAVALDDKDGVTYQYAIDMTPDGAITILLTKGDAQQGQWAFEVLPGPPVSEEERLALPEWGAGTADEDPDRLRRVAEDSILEIAKRLSKP